MHVSLSHSILPSSSKAKASFLKKIYQLLKELQNEYALSLRYVEIQMDVLSTLTKYTQENLDEEIKELCKNYPQYRFMLYYKIIFFQQIIISYLL